MTEIGGWLSPEIVLPLGWSLIHSLWQDLVIAALARLFMAFSRRPATRYLVGVSALALMLAASVATFLVLIYGASSGPVSQGAALPVQNFIIGSLSAATQIQPIVVMSAAAPFWTRIMPLLVKAWLFGVALLSLRLAAGFLLLEDSVEKLRSKDAVFAIGMTRMHVARSHDWCRLRCGDQLRQFPEVLGGGG